MSVFSRFMDIVNANINSLLDKAEDPQKMIRLMIAEMEDTLIELKTSCAAKIASTSGLKRQISDIESQVERWQKRASLAVQKNRDDLAREALIEKRKCADELETMNGNLKKNKEIIDQIKDEIIQIEDKLKSVKDKYKSIIEKANITQAGETIYEKEFDAKSENYDRLDEELEKLKKQNADEDLESQFRNLEEEDSITEELNKLKGGK